MKEIGRKQTHHAQAIGCDRFSCKGCHGCESVNKWYDVEIGFLDYKNFLDNEKLLARLFKGNSRRTKRIDACITN